ncbi:CAMK/CAMKL protein kinase Ppk16 [Schizosaccharomyces japonicus yFS275]|uniref:non-specific serine/threonine protein kinase n=1 Tax=Schizosaccharomyces japonicus (strain yFS275 / FY16936) TaxID=402676 RepID=B6K138_SCHJY|nr:CAMK/CAMKL protein kinase Ppk16 [Schizosaccharomyces japonicus yFS275]EEB07659.1 CAMK/CAMKL protein kinase Ppk16 [Schizosaccharomyces japonicus yFS275]
MQNRNKNAFTSASYNELVSRLCDSKLTTIGNYRLEKVIGEGSFGKVYLASHILTSSKVVLKSTSRKHAIPLAREIHHLRQLKHPNVTRLYEVVCTKDSIFLVLEYCPGGELYEWLYKETRFEEDVCCRILWQLCQGVRYIHNTGCVHRDLKLENVFLDKQYNVKIGDFGLSRESDCSRRTFMNTRCGTVAYTAPEIVLGQKYIGEFVDIWALGVIMYALLVGKLPFDEDDVNLTKSRIVHSTPVLPESLSAEAKDLILMLLQKNYQQRPSLDKILTHSFFTSRGYHVSDVTKARSTKKAEEKVRSRLALVGVDMEELDKSLSELRCDALYGWWFLLLERELRKETRKQRRGSTPHKTKDRSLKFFAVPSSPSVKEMTISATPMRADYKSYGKSSSLLTTFREWLFHPKYNPEKTPFNSDAGGDILCSSYSSGTVEGKQTSNTEVHSVSKNQCSPEFNRISLGKQQTSLYKQGSDADVSDNMNTYAAMLSTSSDSNHSHFSSSSLNFGRPPDDKDSNGRGVERSSSNASSFKSVGKKAWRSRSLSNVSSASSNSLISIVSSKPTPSAPAIAKSCSSIDPLQKLHLPRKDTTSLMRHNASAIRVLALPRRLSQSTYMKHINEPAFQEEEEEEAENNDG